MEGYNNGNSPRDGHSWQEVNNGVAGGNNGYVPPAPAGNNDTVGIIGLIAGIVGVLMSCCWPLGLVLGITALVCGIIANSRGQRFSVAGIVLGIIALLLGVIFMILSIANLMYFPEFMDEFMRQVDYY
mgnify:CR=1 FL=1